MIEVKDLNGLYSKFSKFISKSYHEAGINIELINHAITFGDYFDFLEKDELNIFTDKDIDEMIRDVFGPVHMLERQTDIGDLYWAGKQYISLFLNCCIPLRTIFLLFPLKEMVSHFDLYHEMSNMQMVLFFEKEIMMKRSILRTLRKEKNFTVKQLSLLTKIPEQTIKYYESSNMVLFKAPINSVLKIANILSCPLSFFKRESDFIPFTNVIMENCELLEGASLDLEKYFSLNDLHIDKITYNVDDAEQPCLCIGNPSFILIHESEHKDKKISIFDNELKAILKNRIHLLLDLVK